MGLAAQTANRDVNTADTVVNTLEDRRSQVSGVSLDEEMTNLVKFPARLLRCRVLRNGRR